MRFVKSAVLVSALMFGNAVPALSQTAKEILVVAGPRTPESLELDYPSTEAVQEARKNVYERLLGYEMIKNADGVMVENFDKLVGALAENWKVSPDRSSI